MDILPILETRQGRIQGVLHCFTGDVALMHRSLAIGFHIGIGGIVTYPNAKDIQAVAREVPEGPTADRNRLSVACSAISAWQTE